MTQHCKKLYTQVMGLPCVFIVSWGSEPQTQAVKCVVVFLGISTNHYYINTLVEYLFSYQTSIIQSTSTINPKSCKSESKWCELSYSHFCSWHTPLPPPSPHLVLPPSLTQAVQSTHTRPYQAVPMAWLPTCVGEMYVSRDLDRCVEDGRMLSYFY